MQQNSFSQIGRPGQFLIAFLVLILCIGSVFADEPSGEPDTSLTVSLGYVSTSGNSKTTTGNFKSSYMAKWKKFDFGANASFIFTDVKDLDTGETSRNTEKYTVLLKSDYRIAKKGSVFLNLGWQKDRPSGIQNNFSIASGLGRTLKDTKIAKLKFGLGLEGFRETKIINEVESTNSRMAMYFQLDYQYRFNPQNTIRITNETRMSFSNYNDYRVTTAISYVSAINHTLALEVAFQDNFKNLPVEGKQKSDTISTVNLVFKF